MKFDKSQDSSWNTLVVYINSQFILADSKPQKNFFLLFVLIIDGTQSSTFKKIMTECN